MRAARRLHALERQLTAATNNKSDDGQNKKMLAGLRVVELATVVAAPSACALLADYGV